MGSDEMRLASVIYIVVETDAVPPGNTDILLFMAR